jgi:hypothetical protein
VITSSVQRWRDRRDSYRPAREVVDVRQLEVDAIASDATARAFVQAHHYSGSYPAARFRFGLYQRGRLAGVAVFSQPTNDRTLDCVPGERLERVELGRFVLLDDVGANAETWFLGRCFDELRREGLTGVVSFSDPEPRTSTDGGQVFPGHVGTIYQAHNAVYLGRGTARTHRLLPDGTVLSPRARQKLIAGERGWRYVVELLERHGAERLASDEDRAEWARRSIAALTRPLKHAGNHKYAWALRSRDRRHLPATMPYPKVAVDGLRGAA